MALIPVLLRDLFEDCLEESVRPCGLVNKRYGNGFYPEDILMALESVPRRCKRKRCWRQSESCAEDADGIVAKRPAGEFHVNVDVQQFKPEEISVKATDKSITVEGKHEEKDGENGYVLRHFVRRYQLPDGHDNSKISSTLSSDGVLTISAPKLALPESDKERVIPVKAVESSKETKETHEQKEVQAEKSVTLEDLDE